MLQRLSGSNVAFEAVADLCEMSARHDPALKRLSEGGPVKVAACFPRAVKWLFSAANAPLPVDTTQVLNMRTQTSDEVISAILDSELEPNLPRAKETRPTPSELPAS